MTAGTSAEDAKLVNLARGARARIGAPAGACVRDTTGRSYAGAEVVVGGLPIGAMTLALAQALAAGAEALEGAAVVAAGGADPLAAHERAALRDLNPDLEVLLVGPDGAVVGRRRP